MSKIAKSFTIDDVIYFWLKDYSQKHGQKMSYVLNSILRNARHADELTYIWNCPECDTPNRKSYDNCHKCDTKRPE